MNQNKNKVLFDNNPCNVSLKKRVVAYIIDWLLGALLMMLPMWIVWLNNQGNAKLLNVVNVYTIAVEMSYMDAYVAGTLGLACAIFYYVIIPWRFFKGQTIGKKIMGFRMVKMNDTDVDLKTLILRQVVGIILLESVLYNASLLWESLISLIINYNISVFCMFAGFLISICSCMIALFYQSHRMIHDYIANTKVVLKH